jgi:hypothetical protein
MKAKESFVYIKALAYLIIAGMIIAILYRIFTRISNFLKTKEEKTIEFAQEIESGEDYLEPGAWKKLIPIGKKPSDILDFNKLTSIAISWYVAKKEKDGKMFLRNLKRLNTKFEAAMASQILFNQYKLIASSVAQDLGVYQYAKKYVNSLLKN